MTFRELAALSSQYPLILIGIFAGIPVLAFLIGVIHPKGKGGESPWRFLYSGLIYFVAFCGIFAALLTAYILFFTSESLLDLNLLVFLLPVVSMAVTLFLINRSVRFEEIPGFDRLSGLMVLIAITFLISLLIQKTRIWLAFGSSFFTLIAGVVVLVLIVKWAASLAFGKGRRVG